MDNENNNEEKYHLFDNEIKQLAGSVTNDTRQFARFLKKLGDNAVDPNVKQIIIMAINTLNQRQ
jgi:hypothetical protein